MKSVSVAVDIGATNTKVIFGRIENGRIVLLKEISYPTPTMKLPHAYYFDVFAFVRIIEKAIGLFTCENPNCTCVSMAIDTCGAAYGFLDERERLLQPVYHYRDRRTGGNVLSDLFALFGGAKALFRLTGCQVNQTYTLPHLFAYREENNSIITNAEHFLFLPDLLGFFFTGKLYTEKSILGTSGIQTVTQDAFNRPVIEKLFLRPTLFHKIVEPGTQIGRLTDDWQKQCGTKNLHYHTTFGHDTLAGLYTLPSFSDKLFYISIGTNVSMGRISTHSVTDDVAYEMGIKNCGYYQNKIVLYRDFPAFHFVNEMLMERRMSGVVYSYDEIDRRLMDRPPLGKLVDLEDETINHPLGGSLTEAIDGYLKRSGQQAFSDDMERFQCLFESIACKIRYYFMAFNSGRNETDRLVYAINGGIRNLSFMRMLCNLLNKPVYAGLTNATAVGNLLSQLVPIDVVDDSNRQKLLDDSFKFDIFWPDSRQRDYDMIYGCYLQKIVIKRYEQR